MKRTNAIALLYRDYLRANAATIMEHVNAFPRYSRFGIVPINTDAPYQPVLDEMEFQAIIVHYSFLGWQDPRYLSWIDRHTSALKIAFIQDEYDYCRQRFAFLDRFGFECVFTLLEPEWHAAVYGAHTNVRRTETTLPGYVSDEMIAAARTWARPNERRKTDIGYRARRLPYFMGRGAQEKHLIAVEWGRRARGTGLALDLDTAEESRLYGDEWYAFLGSCRAVLGVEAGTSTFDLDGSLRRDCAAYLRDRPDATFEEVSRRIIAPAEDQIYYRTISPRHFEAAAFDCTQILFEGRYSGILEPGAHYLCLKKDFSNFDEIVSVFRNESVSRSIRERAYEDLIASGRYTYERFVKDHFDAVLLDEGLDPDMAGTELESVREIVKEIEVRGSRQRRKSNLVYELYHLKFPGRAAIGRWGKALGIRRRTHEISLEDIDAGRLARFGRDEEEHS